MTQTSASHRRSRRPVFGIVGWKKSGKTTLTAALVRTLTAQGLRVATVKHAHHGFRIDDGDTDSAKHRRAGARQVAIAAGSKWAVISDDATAGETDLDTMLRKLDPADIVLVEGFKGAAIPKIEARRRDAVGATPLARDDPHIVAIATDAPDEIVGLPVLDLSDVDGIARFILAYLGMPFKAQADGS